MTWGACRDLIPPQPSWKRACHNRLTPLHARAHRAPFLHSPKLKAVFESWESELGSQASGSSPKVAGHRGTDWGRAAPGFAELCPTGLLVSVRTINACCPSVQCGLGRASEPRPSVCHQGQQWVGTLAAPVLFLCPLEATLGVTPALESPRKLWTFPKPEWAWLPCPPSRRSGQSVDTRLQGSWQT